ncbi:hypothetical protein SASPL_120508 [Salvia splendens]|uniref:EGF-like calcium-binding domain-containing protein n=1 Tax=Salvia splendens TaxID=180675 RepID=A0A8X8XPU2_SALSN|nr:hypothetical protein SASPL_120508 [Salvia splendens]
MIIGHQQQDRQSCAWTGLFGARTAVELRVQQLTHVDTTRVFVLIAITVMVLQDTHVAAFKDTREILTYREDAKVSISSSIAKVECLDQCGEVLIPFPFGVGPSCYLEPSFEVVCNTATNPAKPFLRLLNTEIVELNSSKIVVNYMNIASTCYNMSDSRVGITKPEERRLTIDLLKTPYRLSDGNWINAIGCDFMAVGIIGEGKRSSIRSSCAAICLIKSTSWCNYGPVSFGGDGCCRVPIPRGTTYLEANLTELSERWTNTDVSCSYSFIQYIKEVDSYKHGFPFMKNSSDFRLDTAVKKPRSMALDWRIGVDNCKDAKDQAKFVCQDNSDCVDFDGGYLCNCTKGYKGNPYLNPGCQG